jgi:hypothetical protein
MRGFVNLGALEAKKRRRRGRRVVAMIIMRIKRQLGASSDLDSR